MRPSLRHAQLSMPSLCALLACATAMPTAAAPPAEVTVYRCTGADGRVAIGDTPCASGERQQVRTMLRPVDGTPMARPAPAPAGTVAAPPAPQVIVLRPPQPMYRCVRPDGTTYTSDTSDGNPRWVPLWTEGYGAYRRGTSTRVEVSAGSGGGRVGIDNRLRGGRVPDRGFYGAGTWIRDECRPLPQSEVCSILGTRREEIRRRFFNAQPTERAELGGEERSITARLAQDCER